MRGTVRTARATRRATGRAVATAASGPACPLGPVPPRQRRGARGRGPWLHRPGLQHPPRSRGDVRLVSPDPRHMPAPVMMPPARTSALPLQPLPHPSPDRITSEEARSPGRSPGLSQSHMFVSSPYGKSQSDQGKRSYEIASQQCAVVHVHMRALSSSQGVAHPLRPARGNAEHCRRPDLERPPRATEPPLPPQRRTAPFPRPPTAPPSTAPARSAIENRTVEPPFHPAKPPHRRPAPARRRQEGERRLNGTGREPPRRAGSPNHVHARSGIPQGPPGAAGELEESWSEAGPRWFPGYFHDSPAKSAGPAGPRAQAPPLGA